MKIHEASVVCSTVRLLAHWKFAFHRYFMQLKYQKSFCMQFPLFDKVLLRLVDECGEGQYQLVLDRIREMLNVPLEDPWSKLDVAQLEIRYCELTGRPARGMLLPTCAQFDDQEVVLTKVVPRLIVPTDDWHDCDDWHATTTPRRFSERAEDIKISDCDPYCRSKYRRGLVGSTSLS